MSGTARPFLREAVHQLVRERGIRQFVLFGPRAPAASTVRVIVRDLVPDARVARVLAGDPRLARSIDFTEPVALIVARLGPASARRAATALADGTYVVQLRPPRTWPLSEWRWWARPGIVSSHTVRDLVVRLRIRRGEFSEQFGAADDGAADDGAAIDEPAPSASAPGGAPPTPAPGPAPPSAAASPPDADPGRYLVGELPARARIGREVSLIVSIAQGEPDDGGMTERLPDFFVGHGGTQVTLIVRTGPGLTALDDLQQAITVPQRGDGPLVRFALRAEAVGLARIRVTAWLGGTFLAELRLEVSVEPGPVAGDIQPRTAPLAGLRADPGEVTLQVQSDGTRYSFQLLSQQYLFGPELAKSLTDQPGQAVERTIAMLRRMAADTSGYTRSLAARWIRETGTGLWQDLMPKAIQDQFWQLRGSITSFTIACEDDQVPWELLYPLSPRDDHGFLVEQFPVLRRVYGQRRADRVCLTDARYVVPPKSPADAADEVAAIGKLLGRASGTAITDLESLLDLLDTGDAGLLHFACHNAFALDTGGSSITMNGGPFVPAMLNSAAGRHSLAARSPLVFVNACRSAGVAPEYTRMMGWASQFMAAGAGAFVGTLWPVRSSRASTFAESFYSALAGGTNLGRAVMSARTDTRDEADPTWLAYTAYGDPAAVGGR